jgi:hypothetical protein
MRFDPQSINRAFKAKFEERGWSPVRAPCDHPAGHYVRECQVRSTNRGAFREMDFVKGRLGVEV